MRSMYRAALAAFAVAIATSAVAASAALAAPEWYSQPLPTPEWRVGGVKLTEATATRWSGTVKLYDEASGVAVECKDTGEGSAGPGAGDKETKWTMSSCVTTSGTCPNPSLAATGLSWKTELSDSGETINDLATSSGSGTPGFRIACSGIVKDTCNSTSLSAKAENAAAGANATFDGANLTCSVSGSKSGKLTGTQLIEAAGGGKLEAVNASYEYAKLTSALAVTSSGTLLMSDTKGSYGLECKVETEGALEPTGVGKITHYLVSGCVVTLGSCPTPKSNPLHLPWKTELYEEAGVIRDRIVSGGSGTPGWEVTCGGGKTESCSLNTDPELQSYSDDVEALFEASDNKVNCSAGGAEAGEWRGALLIAHPAGVAGIKAQ